MDIDYEDNPLAVERWIESLNTKERELFDKGYIIALYGLVDQLVESKQKVMSKLMDYDDGTAEARQLLSRMLILDIYEKHYRTRINNLSQMPA